jgi:hypothetical protein
MKTAKSFSFLRIHSYAMGRGAMCASVKAKSSFLGHRFEAIYMYDLSPSPKKETKTRAQCTLLLLPHIYHFLFL